MRLEIVIGPDTLEQVQAALDRVWLQQVQVPASVRMEISLAAAEVAANIVEHGNGDRLWLAINVGLTQMHVTFTDNGSAIAVNLGSVLMPDDFAERGRGLALAKAVLGLLSYHREGRSNHWRLISNAFGAE